MASNAGGRPDHARPAADGAEAWRGDRSRAARFEELILPYLDDAYNLARWLTRNSDDADDIVQEAYLRGLRFFNAAENTNPRAWILTIVRNTFYTWIRAKRVRAAEPLGTAFAEDPDAEGGSELWDPDQATPEAVLARKSEDEALRSLIEALPPKFREALVLREMEELSYQEIATITDVPIGTVMSRLSRARSLLQSAWRDYEGKERAR
jgi:RNA polymerase sigma-70 factor (ECF subfamily)